MPRRLSFDPAGYCRRGVLMCLFFFLIGLPALAAAQGLLLQRPVKSYLAPPRWDLHLD